MLGDHNKGKCVKIADKNLFSGAHIYPDLETFQKGCFSAISAVLSEPW